MRTAARGKALVSILVILLAAVVAFIALRGRRQEVELYHHQGQVFIYDGLSWVWMTPLEGVPANTITVSDISDINGQRTYIGTEYTTLRGVDVSEHQLNIDWKSVADSGVDFAMIRAAYRGYTEGKLFTDPYFKKNIEGALKNGLQVGVYIFSQATSVQEAMEEADYVLDLIAGYNVTMPVVFDWEKIDNGDDSRTKDMDSGVLNDCAVAFCEKVRMAGKTPALYFNRSLGYRSYDLSRMTGYEFWFSLPEGQAPSFYYAVDMWQYSFQESVPGISEPVDMNLMFIPLG